MSNDERLRDYLKRVTIDLHDARRRIAELEGGEQEPIAIIGMSCRYPGGVRSPEDLWELVSAGVDAIDGFPTDRGWDIERIYDVDPEHPGSSDTLEGGFLYDVADFDPELFSITPREALAMDPQQRLLLETSWELFEHAGIDPRTLRGERTGVFIGGTYMGYASQTAGVAEETLKAVEPYLSTGTLASVLSGRISYAFGLEGPALTIDTGCSSSLVAVHMACEYLRKTEGPLALAGGVAVLSSPVGFQTFSRQRGLAHDGRCKSYADVADGTGWSEGAGILLLERLSDAQRLGHRVWATVRGSAINQDGASNGLAAPNGRAQQRVVRAALAGCGLSPSQVDVVEGHGTGTTLGDPIEARALLSSYGRARAPERPLWLGSIKSNIGHTQAAAGAAGVIKMVMALQHGKLPKTLHVDEPSTQVDWSVGCVSLLTEEVDWSPGEEPRRAGVSAFGVSGTNAHVIVEQAPPLEESEPSGRPNIGECATKPAFVAWTLSAKGEAALQEQAGRLAQRLSEDPTLAPVDVALSLAGRAALRDRAVLLGGDTEQLSSGVAALAKGEEVPSLLRGCVRAHEADVAYLFTGQGAQRLGMGRELHRAFPAFRAAFEQVCDCMGPLLDVPLLEAVFGPGALRNGRVGEEESEHIAQERLDRTELTQPALFALEVALFRLLEAWGVKPGFLLGHSIGELAAVHVSGALSLPDACALVAARGRLMGEMPTGGAMVALQASEHEAVELIGGQAHAVAIAAVNGPSSVVISGEQEPTLGLAERWEHEGRKIKRLPVSHAFHSARMDGMLDELSLTASGLSFAEPTTPVLSGLDGEPLTTERLRDPGYWSAQARQPVRFADGIRWLSSQRVQSFLELGPDGVLSAMARECLAAEDSEGEMLAVPTLRRDRSEPEALVAALAQIWVNGVEVDWKALYKECGANRVQLPTYAFQRQRYWLEGSAPSLHVDRPGAAPAEHRVAGQALRERLRGVSDEEHEHILLATVCTEVARVVGYGAAEAVDPNRTFKDFGFDSLMAVELRSRLDRVTGLRLPNTLAFNNPTALAVSGYLLERLFESEEPLATQTFSTKAVGRPAELGNATGEPIAIVGIGCRYPGGVRSEEELWRLVAGGEDAVSKFPADRGWDIESIYDPDPEAVGKVCTDEGGFLYDAAEFDAGFFGIGAREALMMDPQQRLFLEVSWEAIERAGIDPLSLRGTDTGVFAGVAGQDYAAGLLGAPRAGDQMTYITMGATASVLAGRLAYLLDLRGPAFALDAACSSSLVALHLACESLRRGECELALAGGVTVLCTPFMLLVTSAQRGLAHDGRCKSFAEDADGMGFAEGAGVVLLEPLGSARRLGHEVLAVISGSAINQDGTSNGLAAPNGRAQERVIRRALASAGMTAAQVDALEAHGTGTRLGDPIEAEAILATYGRERGNGAPLRLGSLKSNIGHAQAAAGVAGVIKMAMALKHELLPPTLHVDVPTSQVDWTLGGVSLLTDPVPWPRGDEPRRAAVSAFGVSGTNAHVILEEAPNAERSEVAVGPQDARGPRRIGHRDGIATGVEERVPGALQTAKPTGEPALGFASGGPVPWVLSGKTARALREQAARLHEWISARPESVPLDVGYSLAATRSAFDHRAVLVGDTRAELLEGLHALVAGEPVSNVTQGVAGRGSSQPVFVFPGQGSQWAGMAVELIEVSTVFAKHIEDCERALDAHVDWSLTEVLRGEPGAPPLEQLDVLQPALFAVMVSLAGLWRACGVRPAAVVGHSQGEVTAAHVAGGLSLADAAQLVARRSQVLSAALGTGEMASIALGASKLEALLKGWEDRLFIAACNGPSSTVVSGESDALHELLAECAAQEIRTRHVAGVFGAGHSPHMEPLRDRLSECSALLAPQPSKAAFYSTVTATRLDTVGLNGEYWYRNAREPVQFEGAVRRLLEDGFRIFVEVSPHPILRHSISETIEESGQTGVGVADVVASLRRGEGGLRRFLTSLGEAWVQGVRVDWSSLLASAGAKNTPLPTYAFQRRRYWAAAPLGGAMAGVGGGSVNGHGLLSQPDVQEHLDEGLLLRRLSEGAPQERMTIIVNAVREQAAAVLGDISADAIGLEDSLIELGFTSMTAVELRTRLNVLTDMQIPIKEMFERPVVGELASYIDACLREPTQAQAAGSQSPVDGEGIPEMDIESS